MICKNDDEIELCIAAMRFLNGFLPRPAKMKPFEAHGIRLPIKNDPAHHTFSADSSSMVTTSKVLP